MIRLIHHDEFRLKTERYLDSAFGTPDGDKMLLIEVGVARDFDAKHIRKAVHYTPTELASAASDGRFSKATEIVLYGNDELTVVDAAQDLFQKGYPNLFLYAGGKFDWASDGLTMQSSLVPADGFTAEDGENAPENEKAASSDQPRKPENAVPLPEQKPPVEPGSPAGTPRASDGAVNGKRTPSGKPVKSVA